MVKKKKRYQDSVTISQYLFVLAMFAILMVGIFFYLDFALDNTAERAKNFKFR